MVSGYTNLLTSTAGGITKTYAINASGVLGNLTDSGKFYPLSDYELQHDITGLVRNASGQVTGYRLSGADAAQAAAAAAAKEAAAKAAAAQAAAQAAANAKQTIDPAKTAGYRFAVTLSHADQNNFINAKKSNPSLTEYQWRKSHGKDLSVAKGTYTAPKYTTGSGNNSGTGAAKVVSQSTGQVVRQTSTASKGVSNTLTGSQKIAAQSKVNPVTNKPKVVTPAKTTVAKVTAPVKTTTKVTTPVKTTPPAIKASVVKLTTSSLTKTSSTMKSGDAKIAAIKASSSINNSASAKTGTAQTAKAVVKTTAKVQTPTNNDHYGQVQLKDGTWIDQVEKGGITSTGTVKVIQKSNYIPTAAQVKSTGVTTTGYISKIKAEREASKAANEAAKAALGKSTVVLDKMGNIVQQIQGSNLNELGNRVTISTKVATATSKQAVSSAYKALVSAGKTSGGKSAPEIESTGAYTRGKAQAEMDAVQYQTSNPLSIAGAGLRNDANLTKILSVKATKDTYKDLKEFKTAEQTEVDKKEAELQKNLTSFKKQYGDNKITNALATGYYYSTDLPHVQQGINVADKQVSSKLTFLPSSEKFASSVQKSTDDSNTAINKLYTALGKPKSAEKILTGIHDVKKGVGEFVAEGYSDVRDKTVSTAAKLAVVYTTAAAAGSVLQAAKIGSSVGLVKAGNVFEDAGLGFAGLTTKYLGKAVPIGVDAALTGTLIEQVGANVAKAASTGGVSGGTQALLGAGMEFVVGGAGFSRGSKLVSEAKVLKGITQHYDPVKLGDISPKITSAKISEIVGGGADTTPVDLKYGRSFAIGNTPVVTHVKGQGLKGFSKGAGAAPESILSGKTTQSFAKIENPFFIKTVKSVGGETEAKYLTSAMSMAEKVYATRKPLYVAEKFEITSKAIPENQRAAVVSAIKTYDGDIKVAGSVPMKSQSTPFTSREPHDLELYSDSVDATISHITKSLKSRGFTEGKDFRRAINEKTKLPTNQVEFAIKDEISGKKVWDTGIEVFDHSTASYLPKGSKNKSEIAFGYNEKPSVLVGNKTAGFVKTQALSEQVTRKIAGSTFLMEKVLRPAHPNRVKDILDATTSSTAFAVKANVPIEKDIITFVNTATKKFTPTEQDVKLVDAVKKGEYKPETDAEKKALDMAKMRVNFEEKVSTDPVFKFIYENQRLPTLKEAPLLDNMEISDKVLLFEKAAEKAMDKAKAADKTNGNGIINNNDLKSSGLISKGKNATDILNGGKNVDVFSRLERSTSVGFGKSIGYNQKPRLTEINEKNISSRSSQKPLISERSESTKPIFSGRKISGYGDITPKKTDISIYNTFGRRDDISKSTKPTNIISASQRGNNPFARNTSPSPARNTSNWGNVISPSPIHGGRSPSPVTSPSPSAGSKSPSPSPSPGNKSPSPSPSPSPKTKSPSPSPSQSPSPSPSPSPKTKSPSPSPSQGSSPSPSPIISPSPSPSPKKKKVTDRTISPHERKREEKEKKDSMRSWRSNPLFSTDQLVSKTKVAGFRESMKSSNSTKKKATTSAFVSSRKTKLTKMIGR